jgi:RNA polymerase sigma-70 factor (ECF subfamily)
VFTLSPTFVELELPETGSLLGRAQAGDTGAFCELCRAHETRLLRQAMTLCGNETLAEELAQDTLVEAWKSLRRFNGRCQFFTWLCAILLNRFRNVLREKRPLPFSTLARDEEAEARNRFDKLTDEGSAPDRAAELREQAAWIRECVKRLSPKHQQVIYLRFYVDDSLEGIAGALGCSTGTVKSRLFHALDRLRAMEAMNGRLEDLMKGQL